MQAAANQPAPVGRGTSFPKLISQAIQGAETQRNSRDYALDHGVDKEALKRYATGAISVYERREIDAIVAKCRWAMDHVVSLVKARRPA